MRNRMVALAVLACSVLVPAVASAQATLAGVVRDTSGAVLPGVSVEAASDVLIEKVRTVVTDGSGLYRIAELQPGIYTLTFTLVGFTTVRREAVEVTGVGVITINAELRVGAIEETITVTGETPVVDVQSARRGQVLGSDLISTLPATRGYNAIVFLVPQVYGGGNQIDLVPAMRIFTSHGGRANEGRVQVDGLNVGAAFNGAGVSGYVMDTANAQELSLTLSGGLGEAEVGGTNLNVVPRSGGNTFSGQFFGSAAGKWSQGNNLDQQLIDFGILEQADLHQNWDISGSLGGPIKRDRLWFHANIRDFGTSQDMPGMYGNKNVGDPTKWTYAKDLSLKSRNVTSRTITALRLTAQVTPRNKIGFLFDHQFACDGSAMTRDAQSCRPAGDGWVASGQVGTLGSNAPEAASGAQGAIGAAGYADTYQRVIQGTWTSPLTSRLLLEAGFSSYSSRWGWMEPPGAITNLIQVTEQASLDGMPANLAFRALDWNFNNWQNPVNWRASASYVTGAHNMKFGYQGILLISEATNFWNQNRVNYRVNNGIPNRITMQLGNWEESNRTQQNSFYVQDQWTSGRLTLQGALRFDRVWSWSPAEGNGWNGADRFHAQPIVFPRTEGVRGYNDITPRMGAAYDLFGSGKTSLRVNVGKYLEAAQNGGNYTESNRANTIARMTNRSWTDSNGNWVVDCDLMNSQAQNLTAVGGDVCAAWDNQNFGNPVLTTEVNPAILEGWGIRPYDWQLGVSVQHEVFPRTSVEAGYHRRWFGNFFVTDNRTLGPGDFDPYSIVAPLHPDLPGGGGYVVDDLWNVKPEKFQLPSSNYRTFASDFGQTIRYWHGVDITVNTRLRNGLIFQGGTSTGRGVRDECDVDPKVANIPLVNPQVGGPSRRTCRVVEPFQTQFKGLAAYTIPKIDVQFSVGVQLKPGTGAIVGGLSATNGASLTANYNVPNTQIQQSLGRLPSGGLAPGNTSINLLLPGEVYGERINQVDLRGVKILRFGRTRTQVGFDLYNLFNANPGLTYATQFVLNQAFPRPTSILMPRFVRFNATIDF